MTDLQNYDPSGIGVMGRLFGLPFDYDSAKLIVLGVPWEVTVSYNAGTARGVAAMLNASSQLDLYDFDNPDGWKQGIFMPEIPQTILDRSDRLRSDAAKIIDRLSVGEQLDSQLAQLLETINQAGETLNQWLFEQSDRALQQGKRVAVVGGDHSVPLGYLRAIAQHHENFGILHIDAHADLRQAYEGFEYSHASIMYNVLKLPQMTKLVQVGIRDVCLDEVNLIRDSSGRISTYYDPMLKQKQYAGVPWLQICQQIVAELPQEVYISVDVDGFDPKLCPMTGTPVPGGLELEQAFCLFREVVNSGRKVIGFDVVEIGNAEWDGNVAARTLYKLCNLMDSSLQ
ncbi:agmatinase family protein [Leptolyngbya sp. FACHB-17]|uniref:agmatinase family protein n=1 Tax=unclassified Leptolyngbya TaxID=2650499 RepID=UPI0016818E59|nr:agmatinase family protein [Leptolyngbya sp. FACHB-17]MBD2081835.1 agmatinase family protein [Leptolyngbya sp. FACHB-17]